MKISLSRSVRAHKEETGSQWPQRIEFSAREVKRDALGETYIAAGSKDLTGFIVLEKEQYEKLLQIDLIVQASMYAAQASLNHQFAIFNKEGKPTERVATLSTAGHQTITTVIDGREFRAEVSIKGNHPRFAPDAAQTFRLKSFSPKSHGLSI